MNFWKKRDGASLLRREPKARITGEEWALMGGLLQCAAVKTALARRETVRISAGEDRAAAAFLEAFSVEGAVFSSLHVYGNRGVLMLSWQMGEAEQFILEWSPSEHRKLYVKREEHGSCVRFENLENRQVTEGRDAG